MNVKNLHINKLGVLAVAALSLVSVAAYAMAAVGVDMTHLLGLDMGLVGGVSGLLLANGVLGVPVADQIVQFQAKLDAAKAAANGIVQKSVEEGRTLDEAETEEHKSHLAEIKALESHIELLKSHEQAMIGKAKPIEQNAGREGGGSGGTEARGGGVISVRSNLAKGVAFTRYALALARTKGNVMLAHEFAKAQFKDTPAVVNALAAAVNLGGSDRLATAAADVSKAAVPFGTTTDSAFAGPLVQYQDMQSEFIELLRPMTILGRMNAVRRVPFMMRAARQLTGVSGSFVGEGLPKPVGRQTYDNVTLGFAKAAVIVVLSDELVRFSNPDAEVRARDDMLRGIGTYLDQRFIDPSYAGVPNVSPASITNAARRVPSSGTTLAAIDADVTAAFAEFAGANVDPSTAVWVMPATVALRLSMKRTGEDVKAFPELTMQGGTWYGLPVIVSNAMTAAGSPAELQIALVTQEEVLLADEGGISIDMSNEASVQMNDTPSAGAQSLVSLWQNNLIGLRAERYINWAPRRPQSLGIVLIENVRY